MRVPLATLCAAGGLLLAAAGCSVPGPESLAPESVPRLAGAHVSVERTTGAGDFRGELVTVSNDSLWVLSGPTLFAARLSSVISVRVRQHGLSGGRTFLWGIIGGAVTGGGLAAACAQVGGNCGGVFAATAVTWLVVTSISAISDEASSNPKLDRVTTAALKPYARFPQGWPEGLPRGAVGAERAN